MSKVAREGEKIVGEDAFKIPFVDVPEFSTGNAREWMKCEVCNNYILLETNGKTYFHTLACKFSNGIGYNDERRNTTLPHAETCNCLTCEPPKAKK